MSVNQEANLSPEAQRALAALKRTYVALGDGGFTEEGFRVKTGLPAYHAIFEELERAGHIKYADVDIWTRTNYDK